MQIQTACCICCRYPDSSICRDFSEIPLLIQYLLLSICAMIQQPERGKSQVQVVLGVIKINIS